MCVLAVCFEAVKILLGPRVACKLSEAYSAQWKLYHFLLQHCDLNSVQAPQDMKSTR